MAVCVGVCVYIYLSVLASLALEIHLAFPNAVCWRETAPQNKVFESGSFLAGHWFWEVLPASLIKVGS